MDNGHPPPIVLYPPFPLLDVHHVQARLSRDNQTRQSKTRHHLRPSSLSRHEASNCHSLLTLSDIDPFAACSGIAVPHSPIDPNQLSTYSGSSVVPEYITKKLDDVPVATNRVSSTIIGSAILKSSPHHDCPCVPGE
ncbi:hypothetical protein F5879DRAFT_1067114 [Lentinula edodes]|nr:hypothetical protein F5879DRAFT_1067114 [Lentinula edodes]